MWTAPGYDPPAPPPPVEHGRRLATLPRGKDAELRLTLAEYQDRPYVGVRIWERGSDGQLWPAKGKGCSIRIGELPEVIAALRQVEDLVARREQQGSGEPPNPSAAPPVRGFSGNRDGIPYTKHPTPLDDPDRPRYVERGRRQPRPIDPDSMPPPGGSSAAPFDETGDDPR
jgi:hypothetical protein